MKKFNIVINDEKEEYCYFDVPDKINKISFVYMYNTIISLNKKTLNGAPLTIPLIYVSSKITNFTNLSNFKKEIHKDLDKKEKNLIAKLRKKIKIPRMLLVVRGKLATKEGTKLRKKRVLFVDKNKKSCFALEKIGLCMMS